MLAIPVPYISALLLSLIAVLLVQQRGDVRTTLFLAISACMSLVVGLRWSFPHPYLWFAVALVSSVQAPAAWLCFYRPQQGGSSSRRVGVLLPFLATALTLALLLAGMRFWDWVEVLLVVLYVGYGGALLGLGWSNHVQFDAVRFSQLPDIKHAAIWSGCALIFNGVLEGLIGLDYWLHQGKHAQLLVGVAHVVLLPPLVYGVYRAGLMWARDVADAPDSVVKQLQPARLAEPATVPCAPDASQSLVRAAIVSPRNDEAMLEQLTDLVQAQGLYKDPDLSLIKLARRMGVPARELSAMVNRQCGKNIAQWINGFRIAAACEQLASGDAPVTTVMLDCGFFTKSNFNREFRRHTGLSPSAYRQQLRSWAKQAAQTS